MLKDHQRLRRHLAAGGGAVRIKHLFERLPEGLEVVGAEAGLLRQVRVDEAVGAAKAVERISYPPDGHNEACELGEAVVDRGVELVSDDESAEVVQPADGAFDLPPSAVATQRSAVRRL